MVYMTRPINAPSDPHRPEVKYTEYHNVVAETGTWLVTTWKAAMAATDDILPITNSMERLRLVY